MSSNTVSVFACIELFNLLKSWKDRTKEQNFYPQPELAPMSMPIDTETIPGRSILRLMQGRSSHQTMANLFQPHMIRRYVATR
jgi:hypothetical protein